MWEKLKLFAESLSGQRAGRKGLVLGMLVGIAILVFGFWKTFFVLLCGLIGLYLGNRIDRGDDLVERALKTVEHCLPERFR